MVPKTNSSAHKTRLDNAVAARLNSSRARAQALIMEGKVRVDGDPRTKAGAIIPESATIEIAGDTKFVSRGGLKLEHALDEFGWSVDGLNCLDVGASTGGFTDCLLQRGARHVTAVDVGYGQFAWSLRKDPRVTLVERCNYRYAEAGQLGAPFDFACADVSFISLTLLGPKFAESLADDARLIVLVKPQFEAGRNAVKRGVVRDPVVQAETIRSVMAAFAKSGLGPQKVTNSPIAGPAGNLEFLLGLLKCLSTVAVALARPSDRRSRIDVEAVVRQAHDTVGRA
jgi:23S rRNA (cytidine1920-2'-O)/16S rRNA (cytidine1409-2'-O)-methyltransferase